MNQDNQDAAAWLLAVVESSDDAIVSKNLDGMIRSWNSGAYRLFGFSSEEAIGRPITLIVPSELQDEERQILKRLRDGESIDHFETVRCRKDGSRVDVSLTISPVRDSEGRIIGASKIARDITQRKLNNDNRKEAELSARLLRGFHSCNLAINREDVSPDKTEAPTNLSNRDGQLFGSRAATRSSS